MTVTYLTSRLSDCSDVWLLFHSFLLKFIKLLMQLRQIFFEKLFKRRLMPSFPGAV